MSDQETSFEISPKAGHEHPDFSPLSGGEVEEIVVKLAKDGVQASVIGTRLRDQYAVPDVKAATGKTMLEILAENDLEPKVPEDLTNLIHRALNLREHLREHPKDKHNMRGLQLVESRIRKVIKYYKRKEKLPYDWKYTERTAKLLVE